jgi:hypothetical protein
LEINGEAHHLGYFATKQERQSAREAKRRELEEVRRTAEGRTCASVLPST